MYYIVCCLELKGQRAVYNLPLLVNTVDYRSIARELNASIEDSGYSHTKCCLETCDFSLS